MSSRQLVWHERSTHGDPSAGGPDTNSPGRDAALLDALRSGQAWALESVTRMLAGPLLLIAAHLAPSEPEAREAVRAAFVRVFDGNCTWDTLAELRGLLRQTVINIAVVTSPSSDCSEESIESLLPRFTEDGHHASDRSEIDAALLRSAPTTDHALIRSHIARLPLIHRRVLILIDVERLSTADVAQLLSTTSVDVKRRLHEARRALMTMLNAMHPERHGTVMDHQRQLSPVVYAE